jgi:hypothetical protein
MTSDLQAAAARLAAVEPPPTELDDATRKHADLAVDGILHVHYLGDHELKVGRKNIDWSPRNDEQRVASSLSIARMSFILQLAKAYHVTRDERYAEAAADYLREYMPAHPLDRIGANQDMDATLTLSIRNGAWARSLHMLAPSKAFDDELLTRIIAFIKGQIEYLRPNIKTLINWRVFEARSLLMCSLYLSFLDSADEWRTQAVRILNDAWFRQFLPDGVHCERNPIYHGGMAGTFRALLNVSRALPELGLVMTVERLSPMYDFLLACTKPNGYSCGIHDSQSEFEGHLRDGRFTEGHKGVNNAKTWEEFRKEYNLPLDKPSPSQVYPDAGLSFFRSDWSEDALWMSFDATRWGGGHCHLSRNAVQLHAHRQSMVIDPGWLSYASNDWGTYGRTTPAHSTCNLAGLNQSSTNPSRFEAYSAPGYDAVLSVYDGGYWDNKLAWTFTHAARGFWAEHARLIFRVQDRFAFVVDSMYRLPNTPGDPEGERPSFECVWQLAPKAMLTLDEGNNRTVAQWADAGLLLLTPIRPEGSQLVVHEGEMDPIRGWTPGEGAHHPEPQLVVNTPRMDRQHDYCVAVLVPYRGSDVPLVDVEAKSPMGTTGYVKLRWADGTADEIYWGCNLNMMLGKWPDFDTDSSLVHLRKDASGKVTGGCCVNATYIDPFVSTARDKPATFTF